MLRPARARGLTEGITIRRSADRDHTSKPWLDSRHALAFGTYDRIWVGLGVLKVLNEDRIQVGGGFGDHPHWDMEIITWVLQGVLEHRDNLGHRSLVAAGEVQRLSAGTGVEHSERNASEREVLHLYQLWIQPATPGLGPEHEQRSVALAPNRLTALASPDGRDGSVRIRQDALVLGGDLQAGVEIHREIGVRRAWIQVASGAVEVDDVALTTGDGAAIIGRQSVHLAARADARLLVIDVP